MEISVNNLNKQIYNLRGCPVVLDSDLADMYQVKVKALNQAVKRNMERFPEEFMFKLTREEFENLGHQISISRQNVRSQIVTLGPDAKFLPYMPYAFTEFGVAMLSSVLHSERAIQVNIGIMKAFIQLRKQAASAQSDLAFRIESLEKKISHLESKSNPAINDNNRVLLIQSTVAGYWGLQVEDLQSATRKKSISLARQVAIYLIRKQMQLSYSEIGAHFGERDHTTILHAYRKILFASGNNRMLHETLMFLEASLRGIQPAQLRSLPA